MKVIRRFRAWRRLTRMRSRCVRCGELHSGDVFHPDYLACWTKFAVRCDAERQAFENATREPKRLLVPATAPEERQ